ncbi:MAG: S8 family serine peptidase [Candidatus Thorarchaeota archaeon]
MLKKYLVLVIVLSMIQLPLAIDTKSDSNLLEFNSGLYVESTISSDIFPLHQSFTPSATAKGNVILQFDQVLDAAQLQIAELNGVVFSRRDSSIIHVGSVYAATITDTAPLEFLTTIGLTRVTPSKQFIPSLATSVPAIGASDVWENFNKSGVPITGTGVTVAVIDTGASWLHPAFWRSTSGEMSVIQDGPDFYVDLNDNAVADSSEGPINTVDGQTGPAFTYSSTYMFIDVNNNGAFDYSQGDQWLGPVDADDDGYCSLPSESVVVLDESKIAILYDQHTDNVYVRGVNMSLAVNVVDSNGHGTHVASTIAGGQPGMTSNVGVAPGADLIIIMSTLDSVAILDGIQFAIENDADIINMSFSSYLGFLDGTDPEDLAISQAFLKHGVLSTLAAGNLGGREKHARFDIPSGDASEAFVSISNPQAGSFVSLLWTSTDNDEHVILTSPDGTEEIDLGAFSSIVGDAFSLETSKINAYIFPDSSSRGMNRIIIQMPQSGSHWESGNWNITLQNPSGEPVWVDAYAWDNSWTGTSLRFATRIDNTRTISTPGTADYGVTVTSCNDAGSSLSPTSSKGPRIDGAFKPDIAAPGESIVAASNSLSYLWASKSGTSMAAPHVAGALALIHQASNSDNGWVDLSALYAGAGGTENHYSTPSDNWGYGLVDPARSSQHLLSPELEDVYWNNLEILASDPEETSNVDEIDILTVQFYQTIDELKIRVEMAGTCDFTGTNALTLGWDIDSSLATGLVGIDTMVNISGNQGILYIWNGATYIEDVHIDWFNDTNFVYVALDRTEVDEFGRISVSTSNTTDSFVDSIESTDLHNQWSPIVESVTVTSDDTIFEININCSDADSSIDALSIGMSVVDFEGEPLNSEIDDPTNTTTFIVDTSEFDTTTLVNLIINVSDGQKTIYLPYLLMTAEMGTDGDFEIKISAAVLDQEVIRVGMFQTDRITGNINISGYLFVNRVELSFLSDIGLSINVTLTGSDGVYDFDISPSGFVPGEYSVSAIVYPQLGDPIIYGFATLTVIQDDTILYMVVGIVCVGIVILIVIRFMVKRRGV